MERKRRSRVQRLVRRALLGGFGVGVIVVVASWWKPVTAGVPRSSEIVFDDVTLVTPGLSRQVHQRLVVRGAQIAEISEAKVRTAASSVFVLPGMIDMHTHLPPRLPPQLVDLWNTLFLLHGVTTIREVGSLDGSVFSIREQITKGARAGPRIFACGPVLDGAPPTWPVARVIASAGEADDVVEELAAEGADCIKVYDGLSVEVRAAVRIAAHRKRLPVVGHVPASGSWNELGLDDVQHLCYTRCNELAGIEDEAFVHPSFEQGLAHTPTLVVFEGQWLLADYAERVNALPYRWMPRFWRESLWNPKSALGLFSPELGQEALVRRQRRDRLEVMKQWVRRLHARGVRLHAGTDPIQPFVVPGASLHRELSLLVESGLSNEDALAAATWVAGDSLGVPGLGRLEVGAPADLLLLREDPTRDLANLATLEAVVADGRVYPVAQLERDVDAIRAYFDQAAVDLPLRAVAQVAMAIARRAFARATASHPE